MKTTVKDIRNRFFQLFGPVIKTPDFHQKYQSFSSLKDPKERFDICEKNWGLTMAYVQAIASHLDVADFASEANRAVPPEIILTAYTAYWQITQTLAQMDQAYEIEVPESDPAFLLYMFADFLGESAGTPGT